MRNFVKSVNFELKYSACISFFFLYIFFMSMSNLVRVTHVIFSHDPSHFIIEKYCFSE